MRRWPNNRRPARIPTAHALVLGLLQGPTELLPVSSSGHLELLPWLLGWEWRGVDEELRKAFAVALHGGGAAALAIALGEQVVPRTAHRWALLALSVAPAAVFGYMLERPVERRLGTPPTVALGLLGGGAMLAWSDRFPQLRTRDEACARDALWLGLAQAAALVPGVSRGGATLAAARWRRFKRPDAQRLQRELALPVIAGAAVLKGSRLRVRRLPPASRTPFLAGAAAAFFSTLGSMSLLRVAGTQEPLSIYAAYRAALAGAVLARLRTTRARPCPPRGRATSRASRR